MIENVLRAFGEGPAGGKHPSQSNLDKLGIAKGQPGTSGTLPPTTTPDDDHESPGAAALAQRGDDSVMAPDDDDEAEAVDDR